MASANQAQYPYYGTPQATDADLPFLRPANAIDPARASLHDSASTTPTPYDSSFAAGTPTNSAPLLPAAAYHDDPNYPDPFPTPRAMPHTKIEDSTYYDADRATRPWYKKPWFWFLAAAAVAVVVVVIVVPVVLVANKDDKNDSHSGSSAETDNGNTGNTNGGGTNTSTTNEPPKVNIVTWGADGSTVTKDDGSTFTYHNSFGGFWVSDPANPFNSSAKPNSWTPALSESWTWGKDRIWGVNLGGLFVLEPFIVPALYQAYPGAVDEWTLSALVSASADPNANNLTQVLVNHYETFITEDDVAQIAGAGLNWVRLPIPFWAIETWGDVGTQGTNPDGTPGGTVAEPFLARVCWQYILRVLGWARKYGLRVNLDLHTVPGSQNGYNHSGKLGGVNFMNGPMGVANAERTLDYIRIITEFVSQPEWQDVIPMFSIVNEALLATIGRSQITSFYLQAHNMIRSITGVGEGKGPFMTIHDGFQGLSNWYGFLPGSDRIAIDTHPYFAFSGQPNAEPIAVPAIGGDGITPGGKWPQQACNAWGGSLNGSRTNFGVTVAGEFSNAINDCGLYVRGMNGHPQTPAPCNIYDNWDTWNATMKAGFMNFALASMDALGDWFFWTWKIGNDTTTGKVQAPLWSYQLGLENGWMPTDPRQAAGTCLKLAAQGQQFAGTFEPWQTGGAGAGTIAASATASFGQFPPASLAGVPAGQVTLLPTYTATRALVTLPPPSFAASATASVGNGWFDAGDTQQMVAAVQGCAYPDAWDAVNSPIPTAPCPAPAQATLPPAGPADPAAAATTVPDPAAATTAADPATVNAPSSASDTVPPAVTARRR